MTLLSQFITWCCAIVATLALVGAISGVSEGWAYADRSIDPPGGKWAPAMTVELEIGWWNSTTRITSAWVPASVDVSSEASRALGVATITALGGGALVCVYMLLAALGDALGLPLPVRMRTMPATKYKAAGIFGVLSLVLSVALYMGLMFGAHNEIRKKFGSDAKVWTRPDWASGSAVLGSCSLLALAYQLAPADYEAVGYMPI